MIESGKHIRTKKIVMDGEVRLFGKTLKERIRQTGQTDMPFMKNVRNQRLGLMLLHSETGGTMLSVTNSSRILQR